ncbi:MAG: hypothetical protein P8077_09330 [Gammaproteobacteria bacterium]
MNRSNRHGKPLPLQYESNALMKNVFCALLFLSLPLHTLLADTMTATPNLANNLETQNQQLNALKHQVKTKEAALKDSETTLQTQSHTLNCLSDLLAAYSHCNKHFNPVDAQTTHSDEHAHNRDK